jgi:hypothetical protein
MESKNFPLKVIGLESLGIVILGVLGFFYAKPVNQTQPVTQAQPAPKPGPEVQTFSASYVKDGKSIKDLSGVIQFRQDVDLIIFVIDTSASMNDDRQELRDSLSKINGRYKGKPFQVVNFTQVAEIAGNPTANLVELQKQIDYGRDLGGNENSFLALTTAAASGQTKYKKPAIVLMTDAAPNDLEAFSGSQTTLEQAANALNNANAEMHVWAAFDLNEYQSGGSAATSKLYPELLGRVKAGGKIYMVKRANFDPSLLQPK